MSDGIATGLVRPRTGVTPATHAPDRSDRLSPAVVAAAHLTGMAFVTVPVLCAAPLLALGLKHAFG